MDRIRKICVCSVQIPFVRGGAEYFSQNLVNQLRSRSYEVEHVQLPFQTLPVEEVVKGCLAWRLLNLDRIYNDEIDLVIGTKFPSYMVPHRNKIIWLVHQYREIYDLHDTVYSGFQPTSNHDDLGQILTAINLDLQRAIKASNAGKRLKLLRQILSKNGEARSRIRQISSLLRPGLLDDIGICEAIESYVSQFVSRTAIPVELSVKCSSSDIPAEATTAIYRIVQEALNNIAKHANASKVSITLGIEEEQIQLRILDDGVGFDLSQKRTEHTLGLVGMRERARLLGGNFTLQASPGAGTFIGVTLPVASGSQK